MNVSARIKKIREEQSGLSKQEIAQLLGISVQEYDDIEKGKIDITLTRLDQIAGILRVSTSYLLGGQITSATFVNNFYNGAGNRGTINIMNMCQGYAPSPIINIEEIQDDTVNLKTLDITGNDDAKEN